jgi:uncharacterized protein (TIGR02646 family)
MRAISKGDEPACLTAHRATEHSFYQNYQGKDALRTTLVAEQRGLCCYCTARISADRKLMKIEHWRGQTNHPLLQLNYDNLLGACRGGEGKPLVNQHCDTRKGGRDLLVNPASLAQDIIDGIRYQTNGEIRSDHDQLDHEIDDILGLNVALLKSSRKSVLDVVLAWWLNKKPNDEEVQARIEKFDNGVDELEPFTPVAVWFLRKRLAT